MAQSAKSSASLFDEVTPSEVPVSTPRLVRLGQVHKRLRGFLEDVAHCPLPPSAREVALEELEPEIWKSAAMRDQVNRVDYATRMIGEMGTDAGDDPQSLLRREQVQQCRHIIADALAEQAVLLFRHIQACRNVIKSRAANLFDRLPDSEARFRSGLRQFERGLQAATWKADAVFAACRDALGQAGEVTVREPDDIDEFLSDEQLNLVQATMESVLRLGSNQPSSYGGNSHCRTASEVVGSHSGFSACHSLTQY